MAILVLNAGSSSLKFAVYEPRELAEVLRGQVSGIGTTPHLECGGVKESLPVNISYRDGLAILLDWLKKQGIDAGTITGVGHRVVHGGSAFTAPTLIDDHVLTTLDSLRSLAPLHLPFGIGVLRDMRALLPDVRQVACFDTAFHATQPELATRLPLPRAYRDKGYRRYGFHGLNYEHIVAHLPQQTGRPLPHRMIAAHLGSGSSMCAIKDGKSVGTTMGFSTADGLVMGTRTGSIDPGVLVALMRDEKLSLDQLEDLLYRKSGLLGLSGISGDMRELLASPKPEAAEAVEYYCYSAARHAASLVPALGGVDAIVFSGGVGENAEPVRTRIMSHLAWLGVPAAHVHVVAANEELTMARDVVDVLGG
ncbi:acetate/propionate family kinase [Aestuariivirga sp.]|uniref:acetate/propionate family kinase n=1 Tax=Aestuariivirga sp. TaxID=2650926 RepID=UPI0039E23CE3